MKPLGHQDLGLFLTSFELRLKSCKEAIDRTEDN